MLIIIYHLTPLVKLNITSPVFYCLVYSLQDSPLLQLQLGSKP